jgi:hypothetical protein
MRDGTGTREPGFTGVATAAKGRVLNRAGAPGTLRTHATGEVAA